MGTKLLLNDGILNEGNLSIKLLILILIKNLKQERNFLHHDNTDLKSGQVQPQFL